MDLHAPRHTNLCGSGPMRDEQEVACVSVYIIIKGAMCEISDDLFYSSLSGNLCVISKTICSALNRNSRVCASGAFRRFDQSWT
jgi:hypothetical protein